MVDAIERSPTLGEIPGHVFRDTRGREHDKHSVLVRISHRVENFSQPVNRLSLSQEDLFPNRSDVAGRVASLRYRDLESKDIYFEGEPVSSRANLGEVTAEEQVVYPAGEDGPTTGDALVQAGITKEAIDVHSLLDNPRASQTEKLSESLRLERRGELTPRWRGYLRSVRGWLSAYHSLAFRPNR